MTQADSTVAFVANKVPAALWAKACKDAALYHDFTLAQRLMPGVTFSIDASNVNERTLAGLCEDGSTAMWRIGLN